MVKIPDKRLLNFNLVCNNPVINPAREPAIMAKNVPHNGSPPEKMTLATTAAPKGKLPSTVKSGNPISYK